jgi:hypothetical protein
LRWPDSNRDSVLLEIPVAAASSVNVTSRWTRTRLRRGPTSANTALIASEVAMGQVNSPFPETATKVVKCGGRAHGGGGGDRDGDAVL